MVTTSCHSASLGSQADRSFRYALHAFAKPRASVTPVFTQLAAHAVPCAVQVACGAHHSVALGRDGTAFAWGWGKYGQLGDGSLGTGHTCTLPVRVTIHAGPAETRDGSAAAGSAAARTFEAVACGALHSLALTVQGDVLAWGCNASGQLGDGTAVDRATPTLVAALAGRRTTAIAGGGSTSAAADTNGRVWAWGRVGAPTGSPGGRSQLEPVAHETVHDAVSVACADARVLALTRSGEVYGWAGHGGHGVPPEVRLAWSGAAQSEGSGRGSERPRALGMACSGLHTILIVDGAREPSPAPAWAPRVAGVAGGGACIDAGMGAGADEGVAALPFLRPLAHPHGLAAAASGAPTLPNGGVPPELRSPAIASAAPNASPSALARHRPAVPATFSHSRAPAAQPEGRPPLQPSWHSAHNARSPPEPARSRDKDSPERAHHAAKAVRTGEDSERHTRGSRDQELQPLSPASARARAHKQLATLHEYGVVAAEMEARKAELTAACARAQAEADRARAEAASARDDAAEAAGELAGVEAAVADARRTLGELKAEAAEWEERAQQARAADCAAQPTQHLTQARLAAAAQEEAAAAARRTADEARQQAASALAAAAAAHADELRSQAAAATARAAEEAARRELEVLQKTKLALQAQPVAPMVDAATEQLGAISERLRRELEASRGREQAAIAEVEGLRRQLRAAEAALAGAALLRARAVSPPAVRSARSALTSSGLRAARPGGSSWASAPASPARATAMAPRDCVAPHAATAAADGSSAPAPRQGMRAASNERLDGTASEPVSPAPATRAASRRASSEAPASPGAVGAPRAAARRQLHRSDEQPHRLGQQPASAPRASGREAAAAGRLLAAQVAALRRALDARRALPRLLGRWRAGADAAERCRLQQQLARAQAAAEEAMAAERAARLERGPIRSPAPRCASPAPAVPTSQRPSPASPQTPGLGADFSVAGAFARADAAAWCYASPARSARAATQTAALSPAARAAQSSVPRPAKAAVAVSSPAAATAAPPALCSLALSPAASAPRSSRPRSPHATTSAQQAAEVEVWRAEVADLTEALQHARKWAAAQRAHGLVRALVGMAKASALARWRVAVGRGYGAAAASARSGVAAARGALLCERTATLERALAASDEQAAGMRQFAQRLRCAFGATRAASVCAARARLAGGLAIARWRAAACALGAAAHGARDAAAKERRRSAAALKAAEAARARLAEDQATLERAVGDAQAVAERATALARKAEERARGAERKRAEAERLAAAARAEADEAAALRVRLDEMEAEHAVLAAYRDRMRAADTAAAAAPDGASERASAPFADTLRMHGAQGDGSQQLACDCGGLTSERQDATALTPRSVKGTPRAQLAATARTAAAGPAGAPRANPAGPAAVVETAVPPPIVLQLQMRLRGGALALVNALRCRHEAKGRAMRAWATATMTLRAPGDDGGKCTTKVPTSLSSFTTMPSRAPRPGRVL